MRKMFSLLAAAAFVASIALPAFANDVTITGELVDVACALKKGEGGHGESHAACAMACAKRGQAQGILTTDAVYTIANGDYTADNNAKLIEFVAKKVTVTGEVSEKDGQKTITITSIKLAN
jgi:type 1 fimbria pilin